MNLADAIAVGLAAGALAALIRVLARWLAPEFLPSRWIVSKPLDCAVCMGGWVSLGLMLSVGLVRHPEALLASNEFVTVTARFALRWLAASAVAMVVNAYVVPPLDPDTVVVK